MKNANEYSLAEIERMNRRATNVAADSVGFSYAEIPVPEEDLAIFLANVSGKRILDSGCGTARYANRFTEFGLSYLGIDSSEKMIELARADNFSLDFVVGSYRRLPLQDESLDGIWNCCALWYEPKKLLGDVLMEYHRVLAPGGVACIVEPCKPFAMEDFVGESLYSENLMYFSQFDFNGFHEMLTDTPFEVEDGFPRPEYGSMTFLLRKT